jgi:hypothetical protein
VSKKELGEIPQLDNISLMIDHFFFITSSLKGQGFMAEYKFESNLNQARNHVESMTVAGNQKGKSAKIVFSTDKNMLKIQAIGYDVDIKTEIYDKKINGIEEPRIFYYILYYLL